MRQRSLLLAALFCIALNASAAERWWDAYNRGVAAVNGKNYPAADAALRAAIAANPTESTGVRAGNSIITYVPHFWLGIAKFNLGDVDGALREWRISEEQGAVARTAYYSKLKEWEARAQTERQRDAQKVASGPKKEAEAAISRAVQMQGTAMSVGGDRTAPYAEAQRNLQDALAQLRGAGTDTSAFRAAAQTAQQAWTQFSAAAEEGRKLRAAAAAKPKPNPPKPKPVEISIPMDAPVTATAAPPPVVETPAPPFAPAGRAAAEVAVRNYRRAITEAQAKGRTGAKPLRDFLRSETPRGEGLRDQLRGARTDADYERIRAAAETQRGELASKFAELSVQPPVAITATVTAAPPPTAVAGSSSPAAKADVTPAYRAFATGDLAGAEGLLTGIVASTPAAEAYLLRGCVRYTRALLAREPAELMRAANEDFKAALQRDASLRLDPKVFSPKLVARFEQVRRSL